MNHKTTILNLALFVFMFATTMSFAQDSTDAKDSKHRGNMKGHMMDHKHMDHDMNMMDSTKTDMMHSMVREGVIDLEAIDENGDGKVFQDVMDWNVISDKPGECPLCGMKLKEVTLNEAKYNLIKNGFEVK